jgi:hypothetical protein
VLFFDAWFYPFPGVSSRDRRLMTSLDHKRKTGNETPARAGKPWPA